MPQYWATRKNHKHYLSCVVSNKPDKYFPATLVYVTLSVIYPAMCRLIASIGWSCCLPETRPNGERTKTVLNQLLAGLTRRKEEGRSEIHAVADQRRYLNQLRSPCSKLFYLKRNSSVSSGCSSNCAVSLRTFPTALSTFQAIICSAGKGRSKSNGGWAGSPPPSHRA